MLSKVSLNTSTRAEGIVTRRMLEATATSVPVADWWPVQEQNSNGSKVAAISHVTH